MSATTFRELRANLIFLIANVCAGLLHYLFQVIASKNLSGIDYADFNLWLANLALFFVIGGLLQYASNFFPMSRARLVPTLIGINILAVGLAVVWTHSASDDLFSKALIIITGAALFGWVMGQLQVRLMFTALAAAHLIAASVKILMIFAPLPFEQIEKYRFSLFIGYLPALWVLSVWLVKSSSVPVAQNQKANWHLWAAPVILSIATAVIPQMDLVLMGRLLDSADYVSFARASLFYKGIYFLIFIFAQMFLPHQIAGRWNKVPAWIFLVVATVISLFGSVFIGAFSPYVGIFILGWQEWPPPLLVFLSCLNMSILAWTLILIQEVCARHRSQQAAIALGILGLEAVCQILIGSGSISYYFIAIPVQTLIVAMLAYTARAET